MAMSGRGESPSGKVPRTAAGLGCVARVWMVVFLWAPEQILEKFPEFLKLPI